MLLVLITDTGRIDLVAVIVTTKKEEMTITFYFGLDFGTIGIDFVGSILKISRIFIIVAVVLINSTTYKFKYPRTITTSCLNAYLLRKPCNHRSGIDPCIFYKP